MRRLFGIIEQISNNDTIVLLQGESGERKELFVKAIHSMSPRKNAPMIALNYGTLADTLLKPELFGYEKWADNTAFKDKPGRLELTKGGTLFQDEIGNISSPLQIRFPRVLQNKFFEPLGSMESHKADVRILTATNKNFENPVDRGVFRHDLCYRMNVMELVLPPLRSRSPPRRIIGIFFML